MEKLNSEIAAEVVPAGVDKSYKSGSMQYIDSREVAEMVEKNHKDLMRDIRRYCKQIEDINSNEGPQRKIALSEFFIETSYFDIQNQKRPCYFVTKKGCEFIAHKLTGIKGTKFTATYINRFHEMEDTIKSGELEQIGKLTKQLEEVHDLVKNLCNEKRKNEKVLTNPFSPDKSSIVEERLKILNNKISDVSSVYGLDRKKTLHYLYQTIERKSEVTLDAYMQVYRHESKDETAFPLQMIAANTELYDKASELIEDSLERKKVFG